MSKSILILPSTYIGSYCPLEVKIQYIVVIIIIVLGNTILAVMKVIAIAMNSIVIAIITNQN